MKEIRFIMAAFLLMMFLTNVMIYSSVISKSSETDAVSRALRTSKKTTEKDNMPSPYAYTFVIGAIHEDRLAYKGFVYGVLISVNVLRKLGSKADFVVLAQLSPDSSLQHLPDEDMRLFTALNIHVKQLAKEEDESFARLVYEKFRPLQMTQYRRVMFLDADVLPLVNLDYLFHLSDSDSPVLRPNVIMASRGEPCNAGLFILKPEHGAWERLQEIVEAQQEAGKKLPYPHFDWKVGWGHNFTMAGDQWESIHKVGKAWRFHAGHSDQGLLYYYLKYIKQDVSIVIGSRVQKWMPGDDGQPHMISDVENAIVKHSLKPLAYQDQCDTKPDEGETLNCIAPYRDFAHFAGSKKPWQRGVNKHFFKIINNEEMFAPYRLWFKELSELNDNYSMGLDVEHWDEKHLAQMKESPLGYMAQRSDILMKGSLGRDSSIAANNTTTTGMKKSLISGQDLRVVKDEPVTIAYAVSFIKCGDFQTHAAGLVDASLVLRHSIHQISSRNPDSGSRYDYKMYAIVHRQAEACSKTLRETGFEVVLVDSPVRQEEIQGEHLRKKIHREWCCGADEFIKLYAYTLPEEIVVHVDIDFAFYKPMDDLFDAMLFGKDSIEGQAARKRLLLERPRDRLPGQIGAFITRDWPQVAPNKFPPAYQAGFLVARRDPSVLEELTAIIKEGNYTDGWGWKSGWGEKGYGGFVGAMAMQGLLAYYYDHIRPNTAVELNQCRFNHMGMDVLYRKQPNFRRNVPGVGGCRNGLSECEDCMKTAMDEIYSVHYTMCRKPWQCIAIGSNGGKGPDGERGKAINTDTVDLNHCHDVVRRWHDLRTDLESKLYILTNDESIKTGTNGTYRSDIFGGHCQGDGNSFYNVISASKKTFQRIPELYDDQRTSNNDKMP